MNQPKSPNSLYQNALLPLAAIAEIIQSRGNIGVSDTGADKIRQSNIDTYTKQSSEWEKTQRDLQKEALARKLSDEKTGWEREQRDYTKKEWANKDSDRAKEQKIQSEYETVANDPTLSDAEKDRRLIAIDRKRGKTPPPPKNYDAEFEQHKRVAEWDKKNKTKPKEEEPAPIQVTDFSKLSPEEQWLAKNHPKEYVTMKMKEKEKKEANTPSEDKKLALANDVLELIGDLRNHPGKSSAVGTKGASSLFGRLDKPIGGSDAAGFNSKLETLKSKLTLENLGLLKGTLSDKDMQVLQSAATSLNADLPEKDFDKELGRLFDKMEMSKYKSGGSTKEENPSPASSSAQSVYDNEEEARAAGKKSGDKVIINGYGLVELN